MNTINLKSLLRCIAIVAFAAIASTATAQPLPRYAPQSLNINQRGIRAYLASVKEANEDIHGIMVLRHGKVGFEQWFGTNSPKDQHPLYSVSKTFTATAVGFAVAEGKLKVTDKVISFFPDKLPAEVSDNLKELTVKDLLTMSGGHDVEPQGIRQAPDADWVQGFLAAPFTHKPGTFFVYNSLGTYMLSAIVQKVTRRRLLDYLTPRLFGPLGITGATWDQSPQGIDAGGWGLYLKTEDLAKMGQFILQKGKWNGEQLLPESWIEEATTSHIASMPSNMRPEQLTPDMKQQDWIQGYCYQMWRSTHNSFRADGAFGQYILIIPEKDAVIAVTARVNDMQDELNRIWEHLYKAME